MKKIIWLPVLICLITLLSSGKASAQTSGLFGTRSTGSQSNDRSRTFSGNTTGADSLDIQGTELIDRNARQSEDLVGGRNANEANFIGANTSNNGRNQNRGIDGLTSAINEANAFNRQQLQGNAQNNRRKYSIRVKVAFRYPKAKPLGSGSRFASPLPRTIRRISGPQVQVAMVGKTAILRGTVATNHDRVIAQRLALLEPGVSKVQNELIVKSEINQTPPSN